MESGVTCIELIQKTAHPFRVVPIISVVIHADNALGDSIQLQKQLVPLLVISMRVDHDKVDACRGHCVDAGRAVVSEENAHA